MLRSFVVALSCLLVGTVAHAATIVDAAIMQYAGTFPGQYTRSPSLLDAVGNETGFTSRLPGTGGSIPARDPYITLKSNALELRGQGRGLLGGGDLGMLDMLGVELKNPVGPVNTFYSTGDVSFRNMQLGMGAKVGLYVGVDAQNILFVGAEAIDQDGNFKVFGTLITEGVVAEQTINDRGQTVYPSSAGLDLSFVRGLFASDPTGLGIVGRMPDSPQGYDTGIGLYTPFALSPTLHVGVFYFDAPDRSVDVTLFGAYSVPEPSTVTLVALALIGLFAFRRKR